jgi:SAM-dependent methyltransferase
LCRTVDARQIYRSEMPFMRIVRCKHCGMMYQNPRVAEADMADAYKEIEEYRAYESLETAKHRLFRARIARFTREWNLPGAGAFLDIGASHGTMLDAVREQLPAWSLAAVEISPSALASLRARGYSAAASIEDLPPGLKFDWINLDNVLEHIPDPAPALSQIRSLLKPGGFVYIDVPNESYFSLRYRVNDAVRGFRKAPTFPGHVNLFTRRTLRRVAETAGLRCDKLWLESISVPDRLAGLGAAETPMVRAVLKALRLTKLDVALGMAYFISARLCAA